MRTISAVDTFDFDVLRVPWCGRKAEKKRVKEEGSRHTHTRTWLRTKKKNHQRTKNLCWVEKLLFHGTMSLQPSKTHQQRSSKKILIYSNFSPFSLCADEGWLRLNRSPTTPLTWSESHWWENNLINWRLSLSAAYEFDGSNLPNAKLPLSRRSTLIKFAAAPLCLRRIIEMEN